MMKPDDYAFVLLLLGLLAFIGASADEPRMPEITAQGFSADHPQNGIAGEYPRLRVRIEAIDRIKELTIKERSYEVDLALTKDKYNLQLFGLDQSPRSYPDVTLNLQKYINEKIDKEGQYELHILVTDKSDNTVEKIISVHVHETKPATDPDIGKDASLLQTDLFTLQRTGIEPVKGARLFGIDWKNTDNTTVTIRITKSENSNTLLRMLDKSDFDRMQTINQLAQKVADLEEIKAVVLTTASNKAAGEVFSVSHDEKHYILKVVESSAYPSARGTIVTVKGYYKYQGIAE